MTFRDDILEDIDEIRGIPGDFGIRLFTVTVMSRTWTGDRPGIGSKSDVSQSILVARGSFSTRLREVTSRDILASGGLYQIQDVKIGPFTPPFLGSDANGSAISVFDPLPKPGLGTELFFKIVGPGYAAGGDWFKKIDSDVSRPFSYTLVLRKTGKSP